MGKHLRGVIVGCLYFGSFWGSVNWPPDAAAQPKPPLQKIAQRKFITTAQSDFADLDKNGTPDSIVGNAFLSISGQGAVMANLREPDGSERAWVSGPALGFELTSRIRSFTIKGEEFPSVLLVAGNGKLRLAPSGTPETWKTSGSYYQAPALIEDISLQYPLQPVFGFVNTTVLEVADLDQDGFQDVMWSGAIGDLWTGTSAPAGVRVYYGLPSGGLSAPVVTPLQGGTLAGGLVDFDGDGKKETLSLMTENIGLSSYSVQVENLKIQGKSFTALPSMLLPVAMRATAMDVADLNADRVPDYAIAGVTGWGPTQVAQIWTIEGKSDGTFKGSPNLLSLPAAPAASHEIIDVKIINLDRDRDSAGRELVDVVALWAFGSTVSDPDAELIWFKTNEYMGQHLFSPGISMQLGGPIRAPNEVMVAWNQAPMLTVPGQLNFHDFDQDQIQDLVVSGVGLPVQGGMSLSVVSFKNTSTLPAPYQTKIEFLGTPSQGSGGYAPRIGVEGGLPIPGNTDFSFTLTDAKGGMVPAALFWGIVPFKYTMLGELNFEFIVNATWIAAPILTKGLGNGGGWASMRVGIPSDPGLLGLKAYFSWAIQDAVPSRSIPVTLSDVVEIQIGKKY